MPPQDANPTPSFGGFGLTMLGTKNRNIKILGAAWLVGGGLSLAIALFAIGQVLIIEPSAADEDGLIQGLAFVVVLLALGAVGIFNGLALLRRYTSARLVLAISSLVLLFPSAAGVAAGGGGIPGLLVVLPTLWLTLSRSCKETFASYMGVDNGF